MYSFIYLIIYLFLCSFLDNPIFTPFPILTPDLCHVPAKLNFKEESRLPQIQQTPSICHRQSLHQVLEHMSNTIPQPGNVN